MNAMTTFLVFSLLSVAAQADISINCVRKSADRVSVSLYDTRDGYMLKDYQRYLGDQNIAQKPIVETNDIIVLALDLGTSVKRVYSFEKLAKCFDEGSADVTLEISNRDARGETESLEALSNCRCYAD